MKVTIHPVFVYGLLPISIWLIILPIHVVPSLFLVEIISTMIVLAATLFFWIRRILKKKEQLRIGVITSLWIIFWIAVCTIHFSLGQDGKWFSNFRPYQPKTLKQEWSSRNNQTHFYVFEATGLMSHSENLWLSTGNSPFMRKIWSVDEAVVDSITDLGSEIRIYGTERYPWMKPILITYFPSNELIDIREDSTRNRGMSAPAR